MVRRRGSRGVAVLCAAAAALTALPAHAAAKPRAQTRPALTVGIVSLDRAAILRAGAVRVRVRARRGTLARVFALSQPLGRGAVAMVITRTRNVRLRAGRSRTVSLGLLRLGRTEVAACAARTLETRAVLLAGRRRTPAGTFRARGRLAANAAGCRHPARAIPYDAADAGRCDPIDPAVCLQPWPNDHFTVKDSTTATGRRVSLDTQSMPVNKAGKPIDPTDINRNDGFGPGSAVVTRVPGMDTQQAFQRTGAVPITDLARTYDDRQPVVVINTRTLQRQLIWSEIDANPKDPANVNLIIRPAVNFQENTRYIVALRNLRDAAGRILPANEAFRLYRDRTITTNPDVESRRSHFEGIFANLAAAGIDRDTLYRAWDFTVASERSLSERQLAIRDDAFAQLGDTNLADLKIAGRSPSFQVTKVTDFTPSDNAKTARQVEGTYTVPCYLNLPACPPGSRFLYPLGSTHGRPQWIPGNTMQARFTCNIPRVAMASAGARPSLYGHGLFGSRDEVNQDQAQSMGQEHDFVYCATDWVGMDCTDLPPSSAGGLATLVADLIGGHAPNLPECDVPNALTAEADLSNFPTLVDRVDQAFVNFMYLGRLLIHPDGFTSNPAFRNAAGSVIDTRRLFYDGNSQGGIFGGALIALAPDLDRGVIGVPGMNYSMLLQRSSDFGTGAPPNPDPTDPGSAVPQYAYPLYQAYPNELERQLILS
ncbi:MAG: hypothetical protein QOK04_949, partial [Solirubrobacteraceae bacterium]|nr:hypothetical protein [Solirubrobacteraceae bacterium]